MEKVIRVCEMTGHVTVVAENLTTEQAKAYIIAHSNPNALYHYARVVSR